MQRFSTNIKYEGHDLTIRGYWFEGEKPSYDSPGEPAWCEIDSIYIGDYCDCIASIFYDAQIREFEAIVLAKLLRGDE